MTKIYTIGFTKTSAEGFFERVRKAGVRKIVDVRLNNTSQLSGFAKAADLKYFLREILDVDYQHLPGLAPTDEILSAYRKGSMSWNEYEKRYIDLIRGRKVEKLLDRSSMADSCLLCSEDKPHRCHRRLVCEYLDSEWGGVRALHL
ncbi:MAG: DUF488 domain-containing protein [Pseudomonadota bacterium]|jgi:uncharacterized protein (DUF488 family)|nr:DUF488 domain-containing protein [Pseudomonadota bacterium]